MSYDTIQEWVGIRVPGAAAPMSGWLSRPSRPGRFPAVIVGFELFGLTEHLRDITARVARLGYVALAPDFYHRTQPRADLPYTDAGRTRGFELVHQLRREEAIADVAAAMGYLGTQPEHRGRIGFLGFSTGGHIGYLASTQLDLAAAAVFYGGWITTTDVPLSQPEPTVTLTPGIARQGGRILYFAGGQDHVINAEQLQALEQALTAAQVRHELVVYPEAGHGFFCDARGSFIESARDDAWERVQGLFAEELA